MSIEDVPSRRAPDPNSGDTAHHKGACLQHDYDAPFGMGWGWGWDGNGMAQGQDKQSSLLISGHM
jgi:hypothetical protein